MLVLASPRGDTLNQTQHALIRTLDRVLQHLPGETAALSFDPYTDLLWTATTNGTVVSHFLPTSHHPQERSIARYSSFKSHSYNTSKTLLRIVERGVFSLADTSLKFTNRRGIPYWFSSTAFQDACSMAFTAPKSIELLIGAHSQS
ncbi:hypothetical protein PCASD_12264 [Puccinia coronata f. sp. avenae]|uniref:Uncharacterized protein n=1 Tax=Puccinia coronata f. sp. avenae TaxID=200324 RepID=A0A2N5T9F1_9BASI|nr:hypothetical protein PCASD_12264 [Puccinia coronata f. sp. avenae]